MNINYAINNWRGEQKDVKEAIEDLVGTGASAEGFSKTTYYEHHEKDDAGLVIPKDIFSIEYPDDPSSDDDYEYHWYWNWGNGTTDPKEQESEFYHEWQTDSVLEKFVIWLNKAQSCTACPGGYENTRTLAYTDVYFFENVHSAGKSDAAILVAIEGAERKWCNDSTRHTNGFDCLNFKVRDKSVYQTDEGRKAYTVEYEFTKFWRDYSEPLNFQIKKEPKVYTATEIHDGNDAWHISTLTHKDIFDKNPDQFYHFIESFRLVDYNTPVSTVTIPKTPEPTPTPEEPEPTPVTPPETSGFYWGAIVELDKIYYSLEDDINIIVTAPNFNANSNAIEYIGTDANSKVTIITSQGTLDFYKLKETSPDSGVFEGSVSLNSVNTSGTGPWSGKIKTSNQDIITIEFTNTYSGNADTATAKGFVEG